MVLLDRALRHFGDGAHRAGNSLHQMIHLHGLRNQVAGAQHLQFLAAGFICIAVHFVFIVIAARFFRVDVSMAAVSSVSAVGGAASAPVAAAYHREELVPISIMLALLGYGLGNYLGVVTASLCAWLM